MTDPRRRELALFLRSRRERLTPTDVGLVTAGARRTPGLRREEVATLADVGVTWYTWLEQGRAGTPSPQVLTALGRALRLGADERNHLMRLAGHPVTGSRPPHPVVTDAHRQMLDAVLPLPACVQTARFDVVAYNRTYRHLLGDLERFPEADRNCAVLNFLDPRWRAGYPDWDGVSEWIVARLRSAMARHLDDPHWTGLVERLCAESDQFRRLWHRREVQDHDLAPKRFRSPEVGMLAVTFNRMRFEEMPDVRLLVATPLDDRTRERLAQLDAAHVDQPRVAWRGEPSAAA